MSNFRLRDSTNTIKGLIDTALDLGHEVVAITEHETVASAVKAGKYYREIKEKNPNFKLILGNEIYLCRNGLNAQNFNKENDKYYHFILLIKDEIGHEQIRELSTRAWMRAYTARGQMRVPTYYSDLFEVIGNNPGHVIASTACLGGALPTQLLKYRQTKDENLYEKIVLWCNQLKELFGDGNFYLEMQPSNNEEQIYVNQKIVELSKQLKIPYIITNDAHYLLKKDRPIHKAFLNSKDGDREVGEFYATTYLMTTEEIFGYMEESLGKEVIEQAFKNILDIKNKCEDYNLEKPLKIPRLNWKEIKPIKRLDYWKSKIPLVSTFLDSKYPEDAYLVKIIINKLEQDERLSDERTLNEINACLSDIWISSEANNARWSAYFLNLQNLIDICWDSGSLVGPGRGSGVGFLLLFLCDITQINPLWEKTPTFRFRFLNPKRVSPLDIDIDIEGSKRSQVLANFRRAYGEDRVANVLTLRTEKSKSAILTSARGLGIDVDIAQYLSSMIEADRGQLRTLHQTFYGDEENGIAPNKQFRHEMEENYPELWEVAQSIEGLCSGIGVHAGGVIFVDEPFTKTTALMRSPKGEIITQFELHDSEAVSNIKYDILSVEALDKMHICLDLLGEYGEIEVRPTLKETYESVLGIYNIERDAPEMWKKCWRHEIMSLFQMEKQSGVQGIATLKPTSVDDLAILNSTIRLMAQEKGGEMPTDKLARFKENPQAWDDELREYGLSEKEKAILEPILGISYGLCITQEQFMQLVQLPELGGFPLEFADRLRKSIAKKNPKDYEKITEEFFEEIKEKGCNEKFCSYVWNVLISMSKGYGFNASHTLAYSLIGLQELNLGYRFPIEYWNCACLIADSGGAEQDEEEDEEIETSTEAEVKTSKCYIEDFAAEDSEDIEDGEAPQQKKTKKVMSSNYGKIASAIGKMNMSGIKVALPDINNSTFTFSPDAKNHLIRYGLSGISRISKDLVQTILANQPYSSLEDFLERVKVTKPQAINLIKSGAFDGLCSDRKQAMEIYIQKVSEPKKRVTLQNMAMLIKFNLLPEELSFEKKVFNFNKYLKKMKVEDCYGLDNIAYNFYEQFYDVDDLRAGELTESGFLILQTVWDKKYQSAMNKVREYIKNNKENLLKDLNNCLFQEQWDKYATGNISKWEMDSVSYYYHKHELSGVDDKLNGISNFFGLSENPEIDCIIPIKGRPVPLFKISRIAGTVLDRDKNKKTVTLLTKEGVVTTKIFGQVFSYYDKQLSERGADGKKHVVEKSFFTRGNKIVVTGIRRGDQFIAKKYKRTPFHLVELIEKVDENGKIYSKGKRLGDEEDE